jgi:hypothetical protein
MFHALFETCFGTPDAIRDGIPWSCTIPRCGRNSHRLHAAGGGREELQITRTHPAYSHGMLAGA